MFLYFTRGLMRWVGGVHCGDMGAMRRAVRRARPETDSDLIHACVMSRQPSLAPEAGSGRSGRALAAPSVGPPVR